MKRKSTGALLGELINPGVCGRGWGRGLINPGSRVRRGGDRGKELVEPGVDGRFGTETVLAGISANIKSPHLAISLFAGDSLLVAKGGKGGAGVKAPTREANQRDFHRQMTMAEVGGWGQRGEV